MEKNVIVAIVLAVAVLVIYNVFFMPEFTPEEPEETGKAPEETGQQVREETLLKGEEISLENPNIKITINTQGGRVVSWYLKEKKKELLSSENALQFNLELPQGEKPINIEKSIFSVEEKEDRRIVLTWGDKDKDISIKETLQLSKEGYHVLYNISLDVPPGTRYTLQLPTKLGEKLGDEERLAYWNSKLYRENEEGVKAEYEKNIKWLGIRQKGDFIVAMAPLNQVEKGIFKIDKWGFLSAKRQASWVIYAGPQSYTYVRLANNFIRENVGEDYKLTEALDIGFWGYLPVGLSKVLIFFYSFTHNYGLAIILLTLLIYGGLSPLTLKQFESMQKMQAIQPEMKEVQKKFKDEPKKLQAEMMKIYSKHKINPLSGCLPMIIQLPIIFVLYRALLGFPFAENPSFLWIDNLGEPDIPLLLGLGGTMFLQQKISQMAQAGKQQEGIAKMMQFFPLFLILILWSLPSGVMLYWFVSTLISIVQQFILLKKTSATREKSAS